MEERRTPAGARAATAAWSGGRRTLLYAAIGYTLFAVYGSLVPLDFRPMPLAEALEAFGDIRYLSLGIASRADWVANILLFVPLAFFWLGVAWIDGRIRRNVLATALVVLACAALCLGIEFTQLFFPPRTVSLNDILAETLGALGGVAIWWFVGPHLRSWISRWSRARERRGLAEGVLWFYLLALIGYNLLPLDLTVSPAELYHKWKAGRIVLVPFAFEFGSYEKALYGLITDVLIWIPAGFLWRLVSRRTSVSVCLQVTLAAVLLELLQLFVYTRVSDVTDIFTAALGAAIGVALALRWSTDQAHPRRRPGERPRPRWGWLAALLGYLLVLAVVAWYPFDFELDRERVGQGLRDLKRMPFEAYYFGTEYRAATELLRRVLFFLPLGALLAVPALSFKSTVQRRLALLAAVAFLALAALGLELGQILIPRETADSTEWLLRTLGGVAGYVLTVVVHRRLRGDLASRGE